jgi:hypothetical protein
LGQIGFQLPKNLPGRNPVGIGVVLLDVGFLFIALRATDIHVHITDSCVFTIHASPLWHKLLRCQAMLCIGFGYLRSADVIRFTSTITARYFFPVLSLRHAGFFRVAGTRRHAHDPRFAFAKRRASWTRFMDTGRLQLDGALFLPGSLCDQTGTLAVADRFLRAAH